MNMYIYKHTLFKSIYIYMAYNIKYIENTHTHMEHHHAFSGYLHTKLALYIILFILFCKILSELYPFILKSVI